MPSEKVIIFGGNGQVGSFTALYAQQNGVQVVLSMRDTSKHVSAFSSSQEREWGFERVQADLAKPDTIAEAVSKTGAKRAFIYLVFGTPDGMTDSLTALKAAGIEFVVFLSSDSLPDDLRTTPTSDFVAEQHAQAELTLQDVFGSGGYAAVRPGYFATNMLRWAPMVKADAVGMSCPGAAYDFISSRDMGRVCGTLLARGPAGLVDGTSVVKINGPQVLTLREAVAAIGQVLRKDITFTEIDDEASVKWYMETVGFTEPVARGLITYFKLNEARDKRLDELPGYAKKVVNVEKYGGLPAATFTEWVEEHRSEFGG